MLDCEKRPKPPIIQSSNNNGLSIGSIVGI